MQAKSVIVRAQAISAGLLSLFFALYALPQAEAAPQKRVTVFAVFTNPNPPDQDLKDEAAQLRHAIRYDKRFTVLLCAPDDATFKMAALDTHVSLTSNLNSSACEQLARNAGASCYILLSHSPESQKSFTMDLTILSSSNHQAWTWTGVDIDRGAAQLENVLLNHASNVSAKHTDDETTAASPGASAPQATPPTIANPAPKTNEISTVKVQIQKTPTDDVHQEQRVNNKSNSLALIDQMAADRLSSGDSSYSDQDFLKAIQYYRQAIDYSPNSISTRLKLAQTYFDAGNLTQAVDEAKRALLFDPKNADAIAFLKKLADSGVDIGEDASALLLNSGTDPSNSASWLALGDAYAKQKKYDKAIGAYQRAASIHPADPAPQIGMMVAYLASGDYTQAANACKQAGDQGYLSALQIVSSNADNILKDVSDTLSSSESGAITREGGYQKLLDADSRSSALGKFVALLTPPESQKTGYLHFNQGAQLLMQTVASYVSFIESNDEQSRTQADQLGADAKLELKSGVVAASNIAPIPAKEAH